MTSTEIIKNIKEKQYAPVYFLHGEEAFYIDQIADYIEEQVLEPAEKGFNQTVFYGKDADIMTVLNAARRFPMMSPYQVVIVKEAQELDIFSGRASKDKEKKMEQLLAYLEKPLSSTLLVFCYKYGTLDKRLKIAKTIDKNGVLFLSEKIYENKIPHWATEYVQSKGYKLSAKAAAVIGEYLGNDLSKVSNELEKLILNTPKGMEIGINEVEANIGISKDFNVFEFQNALGKKDVLKCNIIINYFAANQKNNPFIRIIATLNNFFSKIFQYHYLSDKSKPNVARVLKVNPFFVQDYELAAKNYPLIKINDVISILREYDLKSKGVDAANVEEGELLKEMVYRILH